ncbi:MAG TPA: HAD family phosphatase [Candidatus Limnocylindrales bacterium]|nr:HAD family phosphatase [Candidatus Limnocylindrales bacterium]
MFEAVIFDWDGTLGDTRQAIVVAFQRALGEITVSVSDEYIERRIGIGAAETFRDILRSAKTPFDEKTIQHLVERKSQLEIELTDQVKLLPGAKRLLDELHGKIRMGLASMNNRCVISHLLKAKDLEKYFDVVLAAESISHSKPNPEIFLKAAVLLKSKPERCVVVEDSVFGVKAAKSANMSCIAVFTGVYSSSELEREKPDLIVRTLEDQRIPRFILH